MKRRDPHPSSKWGQLLFSRSKISKKDLITMLSRENNGISYKPFDNFEIIEILDLYNRLKDTSTYQFELNKDILSKAIIIMRLDPNEM